MTPSGGGSSSGGGIAGSSNNPFAWLGLLKWSLSYSDGTRDNNNHASPQPMNAENRAFLERIMKEGIVDENERMKTILRQVTDIMESWNQEGASESDGTYTDSGEVEEGIEAAQRLLDELRDICEQIDYARAFCALKGLAFLLGCVSERTHVPRSIRSSCLGVLSTVAQHNPPVQKELIEMGALKTLSDLFFEENIVNDDNGELRSRIMQAVSATVRGYDLTEQVFGELEQALALMEAGLGIPHAVPHCVSKRTLFFLRAFLTSDTSDRGRVQRFSSCLVWAVDRILSVAQLHHDCATTNVDNSNELTEMSLSVLVQVLEQKHVVDTVIQRKEALANAGVARVATLRQLSAEQECEESRRELELWELLLRLLVCATPDTTFLPQ